MRSMLFSLAWFLVAVKAYTPPCSGIRGMLLSCSSQSLGLCRRTCGSTVLEPPGFDCSTFKIARGRSGLMKHRGSPLRMTTSTAREQKQFLTYFGNLEIRNTNPMDADLQQEIRSATGNRFDDYSAFDTISALDGEKRIASGLSEDLGKFLFYCAESLGRLHNVSRLEVSNRLLQEHLGPSAKDSLGLVSEGEESFVKDIAHDPLLIGNTGREGAKGASEMLSVVDMQGRPIAVYPRHKVEEHNLLHPAIGALVHNRNGEIYVHQRSPHKSMHASFFDMFVGGLVLAAETVPEAARNEVREELGIEGKALEELFEVVWLGSKNRVVLRVFRVEAEASDVSYNDGEVVWGQFVSLAELRALMAAKDFVPGGKKAWEETVKRGLHTKYLK